MNDDEKFVDHLIGKYRIVIRGSIEFALSGIKISLLINGGALIALLAFSGSLIAFSENLDYQFKNEVKENLSDFFVSFIPFALGLVLVGIASFLSYLHQSYVERETELKIKKFLKIQSKKTIEKKEKNFRTNRGISKPAIWGLAFITLSYFAFAGGVLKIYFSLEKFF